LPIRDAPGIVEAAMFTRDPLANPEALIHRVYAYVAYRIGDGPDAEDITSDTFERALRYRASYDPAKGGALAWLIGIARRRISTGEPGIGAYAVERPEPAASGDLEEDTIRRLTLSAAVAELDDRDRELIALRYGADLTARQIGSLLELRTNAVEVALHRALGRLRAPLEREDASEPRTKSKARL
jgi:RNA polymerase sigma factor (sigma-70 family)